MSRLALMATSASPRPGSAALLAFCVCSAVACSPGDNRPTAISLVGNFAPASVQGQKPAARRSCGARSPKIRQLMPAHAPSWIALPRTRRPR